MNDRDRDPWWSWSLDGTWISSCFICFEIPFIPPAGFDHGWRALWWRNSQGQGIVKLTDAGAMNGFAAAFFLDLSPKLPQHPFAILECLRTRRFKELWEKYIKEPKIVKDQSKIKVYGDVSMMFQYFLKPHMLSRSGACRRIHCKSEPRFCGGDHWSSWLKSSPFFRGVVQAVRALHLLNFKLAVATNSVLARKARDCNAWIWIDNDMTWLWTCKCTWYKHTLRYRGSRILGLRVQTYRGLKWSTKHCRPFRVVAV